MDEPRGLRLPFRRRRSRLQRLRQVAAQRARAVSGAAPDIRQTVATARQAVAERRPEIESADFLQERLRLDRMARIGRRPRDLLRLRSTEAPAWTIAVAALGGFAIGLGIGMWLTSRRTSTSQPSAGFEAAADEIKAAWPQLSDADIEQARGSVSRLVEIIRGRTGQEAESVRERLESITAEG
jgi:hypothetical protein